MPAFLEPYPRPRNVCIPLTTIFTADSFSAAPGGFFALTARSALPFELRIGRMAKEHKYVYTFGAGKAEGDASMKNLLGGKGANLAEMCNIGLPVPAGFTISTDVCTYFYANDRTYPKELKK